MLEHFILLGVLLLLFLLAAGVTYLVGCAVINAGRWLRKRVRDA